MTQATKSAQENAAAIELRPGVYRPDWSVVTQAAAREALSGRTAAHAGLIAITVKSSLEAVPGVTKAVISYADKTAVVTFDDAKTAVPRADRRNRQCGLSLRAQELIPS